ncbi:MAG: hypothetical protein VX527_08050 [Planctomycetota bacterium]|nr:hypothetical protein [Planctomycetota bacterium]
MTLELAIILPALLGIDLQIQPSESSLSMDMSTSVANTGHLIGNHNSETNPDGTITIPGLWGGSGNQEISIELSSGTAAVGSSAPSGSLSVEPFESEGLVIIHDLLLDLLNDSTIPVSLSVTMLYESFHTQNPTSVFPGGIPITLPIASVDLESCLIEQMQSVTAPLEEVGDQVYSINAIVPVMVSMEATFEGQPLPLVPIPAAMFLIGELHYTADGAQFDIVLDIQEEEVIDIPGDEPLPAFPLSLPTIVPPGGFAELLITLIPQSTSMGLILNGTLVGTGEPETLPCDANDDGVIDSNDILAILAHWGPCPGCPADTNNDDLVNVKDILNVLECWPI